MSAAAPSLPCYRLGGKVGWARKAVHGLNRVYSGRYQGLTDLETTAYDGAILPGLRQQRKPAQIESPALLVP